MESDSMDAAAFEPTFSAKTIYVYNSPDAGHEGLVKIGDATVKGLASIDGVPPDDPALNAAAKKRIDSYTKTQGAAYNLLRTELAVRTLPDGKREGFRDHHVHRVLRDRLESSHPRHRRAALRELRPRPRRARLHRNHDQADGLTEG